jgi:hypothetical protein
MYCAVIELLMRYALGVADNSDLFKTRRRLRSASHGPDEAAKY